MTKTNEIRPYGPGKFSTILDSYVYSVTLGGGCDDEVGSVTENGRWYGRMDGGRSIFRDHDSTLETLNEAEQNELTSCAGVIVTEDNQGFVDVEYFSTSVKLNNAWDAITAELKEDEESE